MPSAMCGHQAPSLNFLDTRMFIGKPVGQELGRWGNINLNKTLYYGSEIGGSVSVATCRTHLNGGGEG